MYSQSNNTPQDEKTLEHLESLTLLSRQSTPQPPINKMSTNPPTPTSSGSATPTQSFKFSFAKEGINKSSKSTPNLSEKPLVFQSHDDEEDEEHQKRSKVTSIENGAVVEEREKRVERKDGPLVIKPPETHNEHWLQRRLKMFRPDLIESKPPEMDMSNIPDTIGDSTSTPGLQPQKRPVVVTPKSVEVETEMQVEVPKTADELARELLIKQAADPTSSSSVPNIIIPAQPLSESDVFSYDMAYLSNAPTLETYERVPVEAFGKGILLGLGWKEGTDLKGQKTEGFQEPKKRPDFLGIGAKEEEFLRLDAKGQKIQRKEGLGASWNPLKKVDKITGEVIVEEKESRQGTPKDGVKERSRDSSRDRDRSGVSTPYKSGSRYGTPVGGSSGYDSGKDRGRDRDRDRRRDRDDDKKSYSEEKRRRHGSDRDRKHKYYDDSDYRSQDRDYDSDYYRKRRKEGDRSSHGSHRGSRQPSPERGRSGGSSRDRKDR